MYFVGTLENGVINHGRNPFAVLDKREPQKDFPGIWLWETKKCATDKRGHSFCICVPKRRIKENVSAMNEQERLVSDILTDGSYRDFNETRYNKRYLIYARLMNHSGKSIDLLKQDFIDGKVAFHDLVKWANTPNPVNVTTAELSPVICEDGRYSSGIFTSGLCDRFDFRCVDNAGEERIWSITPKTFAHVQKFIPAEFAISQCGDKLFVSVKPETLETYRVSECEAIKNASSGEFVLGMIGHSNKPHIRVKVSEGNDPELFHSILAICGVRKVEGAYAPAKRTDFTINGQLFYKFMNFGEKVKTAFDNGMYGEYPIEVLASGKLGTCTNARFTVEGKNFFKVWPNQ